MNEKTMFTHYAYPLVKTVLRIPIAKFFIIFLFIWGGMIIEAMPQSTNMNTFEFDAAVIDVSTPKCGLASVLDENNHTHIAWVEKVNDIRSLKYSLFNGVNVTTATVYEGNLNEGIAAPSITLDDNNSPHIAFFVKRDIDGATRSGNYAVYYSGDTDGDGIFETEQVSTNPESPDDNSNGIYHCYVNGRPQITNIEGTIKIFYMSQISSLNGWDNHIISAIKSESGWQHQQEYNSDNIANVSPDNATSFAPYSDNRLYHAYIDLSDYDPYISNYNYGWNDFIINGYSGFGDNKDPHIDLVDGKYYLTWMHNSDSKKAFVVFQLESPWNKTEIPVENSPAGNLFPSTLDIVTGDFVGFYNKSWSDEAYLVTLDESANVVETPLTGIGSAFGKRVLNARNGYISLVTASESYSKIYITTNTGGSTGDELVADFNASLTTITAGESVNFTDASTGNNLSWSWSFPGGSPSSSTLQNPGVAYLTPGTYDVELTISDGTTTDVITKTDYITVNEGTTEFQADFTSTSTIIDAGGTVTFTDQSTGTPSGWQWIFEGGTPATSTESNPVVTYNVTGTYDVTLIAKTRTNADTLINKDYIEVIENGTPTPTYNGGCWQMRDEIVNQQYFNPHKEYFIDSNGAYYFTSNGYSNDSVIKFIDPLTPAWKHALRYTINDTYFDFVLEDVSTNGHLALTNTRVDWHGKPYSSLKILDTDRNEIFAFTDIKHLTIIQSIYSKAELHLYILINETPNATEIIDLSPTVSITTSTSGYKLVKLTFDANAYPVEATEMLQSSEWPGFEYVEKITESPHGGIAMKISNNNHIAFNDGSTLTMNSDENYTLVYNKNNQFEYYVKTSITLDPKMNDGFLLTDNFDVYYYITNPAEWTIDGIELNRVEHATFRKFLIKYNQSGIQWAKALNNFIEASGAEILLTTETNPVAMAEDNSMFVPVSGRVTDIETNDIESFNGVARYNATGELEWVYTTGRTDSDIHNLFPLGSKIVAPMSFTYGTTTENSLVNQYLGNHDLVRLGTIETSIENADVFMAEIDLAKACGTDPGDPGTGGDDPTNPVENSIDTLHYSGTIDFYISRAQEGGYASGNNAFGDKTKAVYFDNSEDFTEVTALMCKFGVSKGSAGNVEFVIWDEDETSGEPGQILTSKQHSFSNIKEDVNSGKMTTIDFSEPVTVDGPFFAGVILPDTEGDTLALYMYDQTPNIAWEQFKSGSWYPFDSEYSWQTEAGLAIFPIVDKGSSNSTPVNHVMEAANIRVYPNPFRNIFTVELPNEYKNSRVKVVDLSGRVVFEQVVYNPSGFRINLAQHQPGMYILQVSHENRQYSRLIQKQ